MSKGRAFAVRSHDRPPPEIRIVNINVLRRDVKIAAHDEVRGVFFRDTVAEAPIPLQFVLIGWRANSLPVRCVNREYPQLADRRCDHACLRIDYLIAKRRANIAQLCLRENRHSVVRFLSVIRCAVTRRLQSQRRKL